MKKFIITEEDIKEIFYLLKNHSVLGVKNHLKQLEVIEETSNVEEQAKEKLTNVIARQKAKDVKKEIGKVVEGKK